MTKPTEGRRAERAARLKWVPIPLMKVSPIGQRRLNTNRVDRLAADFDLEQLGTPTVSHRDGHFYIIDGQHRIEALKQIGWGDQQVQCWTYEGLTEEDESERFLKINDTLAVDAFEKFRIGVSAGREIECDIDRIVRANDCCVSRDDVPGGIGAVNTLRRAYSRGVLGRTVRIVRDAYGDPGLEAAVLDGISLMCQRYNGDLDDNAAVQKLAAARGGVNALLGKADTLRRATGGYKAHCVAAAAVEIINSGRGGQKLPSWWRVQS